MGMKPPMTDAPMKIRGAASNPSSRENIGVKGQVSMQKGGNMGRATKIRNAASGPKGR